LYRVARGQGALGGLSWRRYASGSVAGDFARRGFPRRLRRAALEPQGGDLLQRSVAALCRSRPLAPAANPHPPRDHGVDGCDDDDWLRLGGWGAGGGAGAKRAQARILALCRRTADGGGSLYCAAALSKAEHWQLAPAAATYSSLARMHRCWCALLTR